MQSNDTFLKFKELLRFVLENKYSDFYRQKYEKAGFNPLLDFNSIADIKKIPFLTREELSTADPFKLLFMEEKKIEFITTTSGTTGEPLIIFKSLPSLPIPKFPIPRDKLIDKTKFLLLENPFRTYSSYNYLKKRAKLVLAGDIHNIPASLRLASKLRINGIWTTPTLAIILKDYLERYPDLKKSLEGLVLTGEIITPQKKKFLQELYPNLKIFLIYGLAELPSLLAIQCDFLAQKNDQICYHLYYHSYHPQTPYYFEIIDPITKKEIKFGEKGELVVTFLYNVATPIIRYKTGDLASFRENDCPCGRPGPLLQVWGRVNYDSIRAGGFELRTEMFKKPLLNLQDSLQDNFEGHIYESFVGTKPKIRVALNLSLKNGVKESPELKQKIENEFLENWQLSPRLNLKKAVEAGLFEPLQINFIQFSRSAKARQALILH